jgi:hypothetical protein
MTFYLSNRGPSRMTRERMRDQMKTEIQIAARVCELRRVAENASERYERTLAASGLPKAHFNLRLQLLGRLLPPPKK